ncbi:DNA-processing protein DprA [Microbacterium aurugineum]|uniref:DNA-processing protein DprA n=1 Tax=Microbacterium aurugineum TaxID=2851642 RepID=UPI0039BE4948
MAAARRIHGGEAVADCVARAAWTVIAEPGDAVAGALIGALGAEEALSVAAGGRSRSPFTDDTGEVGFRALREAQARWRPRLQQEAVRSAFLGALEIGARLVIPGDPQWPDALDDLGPHAPSALWVRGRVELLTASPRVSMVGARASSGYGEQVAAELAGDLASTGAVVVSGGAYGIDGAVHRAALGVGGATIAFLAGGVDRAYPVGHQRLLQQISEHGAVVSEPPCGTAPTKWRFLAGNPWIHQLGTSLGGGRKGNPPSTKLPPGRPPGPKPGQFGAERAARGVRFPFSCIEVLFCPPPCANQLPGSPIGTSR